MATPKKTDIDQTESKMDNQIMKFLGSNQNSTWFEPKIFFEKPGHNLDFWHLAKQLANLANHLANWLSGWLSGKLKWLSFKLNTY